MKRLQLLPCIAFALIVTSPILGQRVLIGVDVDAHNLVRIDTGTGTATILGQTTAEIVADVAWDTKNKILYGSTTDTNELVRINPANGAATTVGPLGVVLMHGLEYDPLNDTLYGITNQSGSRGLYSVDRSTGAATLIGIHGVQGLSDLAFDPVHAIMYASEAHRPTLAQALRTVDLATGVTALIGPFSGTGLQQLGVGLAFDPDLGLFGSDNKPSGGITNQIFRIDPVTAQAILVGNTGTENLLALTFIPEPSGISVLGAACCSVSVEL